MWGPIEGTKATRLGPKPKGCHRCRVIAFIIRKQKGKTNLILKRKSKNGSTK